MNKKIYLSLFCALTINAVASDLGNIKVESSTINITESKATEVSTVNFISEEQIDEINPKQINEVLRTIPGLTADVRPGEEVEIHIRGMNQQEFMWENPGVAIIVDGVPVYAKSGKFRINMSDIKNIKVIKGSAAYLYGNNANAGAIIITTSKPRGGKDTYSLSAEYGSYNSQDYSAEASHSTEDYAININGNYRTTDGYWIDSKYDSKSIVGRFSYYINDTSDITLGVDKTLKYEQANRSSVTGMTEARKNPKGTAKNSFQKENDVDLDKYYLTYTADITSDINLMATTYYYLDEYDYISSPVDTDLDDEVDAYSNHSITDKDQRGAKLELKHDINNFAYMLGYEYSDRKYTSSSIRLVDYLYLGSDGEVGGTGRDADEQRYEGETTESEDNQKVHAFYAEAKYSIIPSLTTTLNIRRDIQKDEFATLNKVYDGTAWSNDFISFDKTFKNNGYRAGLVYDITSKHDIYANISTGYRTPTVDKIQNNVTNHILDEIKTQKTITYEIGTRGSIPIASNFLGYEVAVFQMDNKDIIGYEDGTYSMSVGGSTTTTNIGDSRNRGLELALKTDASKTLSFNLAYTYLKSEYTKHNPLVYKRGTIKGSFDVVGNELPRTPNHTVDLYSTYKVTNNLKFITELYAKSDFYADETNEIVIPGYAFLNLQARYEMKLGDHNFEFYAKVDNVFDKQYIYTAYYTSDRSKDGTFDDEDPTITVAPGREFFAGIKYSF
jgi:iron complex outermembrane recepter protein